MKNPKLTQHSRRSQRGATLMIAMIFLVILTLIVVSSIKVTNVNTKVVGNMQVRKEAQSAAQEGIETVISTDFTKLVNCDIYKDAQCDLTGYFDCLTSNTSCTNGVSDTTKWSNCAAKAVCK